ncbi:MAG: hypothetical protein JST84_17465 [Acidobacteria bacterium]|nr:hypothetical protein [Acidobacteriota bacterium]
MYTATNVQCTSCYPPAPNWQIPHQMIWQLASDGSLLKGTELVWEKDTGVSWKSNLRLKEMSINDSSGNSHWTKTTYSLIDGIQLPTQVDEAKNASDPVYRRATTTYTSYPTQRILGLPLEVSMYEGAGTKLVARTTNSYDQSGGYTDANGLALNYLLDESAAQVIQHDNTNFNASFTQRGNLTSVTQSGVNSSGTVTGSRVIKRVGYDTNGNVRWTTDAAGNRAQLLYTDNFLNKPASVGNTQVFVYTAADPTGMRAGKKYDYWTGNLLKSFNLKPNSSTEEQIVTTSYDFADRPFQTTQPTGAWVKTYFWDNLLYSTVVQKTDTVGGVDKIGFSFTRLDGMGRTFGKGSDHPSAATGKYAGQKFVYNGRGEVSDQSNVEAMNATWTLIDEDAASGWLFQNYVYDEMGKVIQIARTDGNMYTIDRQGCGCAGATVTTTDERGCQVQSKTDFLGRLESAKEMAGGFAYNTAAYTYDVLGRIKQIEVKQGDNGTQTQTRTFSYDDYGRLSSETTPEAGTVNYSYTTNDQIATKTDARGKITTFNYNTRNLVTSVSYNDSTPGASYGYDEFGARTSMTDGQGTMSYAFDANRRLQSETRTFTGLTNQTFTLTYSYNPGGQLKTVNYGSSTGINKNVNYAYNTVGALTGVGTNLIGTDPNATTNVLSNLIYNGFGAVKTLNYGNGRRLTLGYDVNRHQMQTMKVDKQDGTDVIVNKSYQYTSEKYDPGTGTTLTVNDGRIQKITDAVDGNYTTTYTYDAYNRLRSASSTAFTQYYDYDPWGNIRSYGPSYPPSTTYNFTNNASGAPATNRMNSVIVQNTSVYPPVTLSTTNYAWDAAGNMTGEGATTFQYDAAGRMVSVNSGTGGSYGFDGDGKRVKKIEGGGTVYYVESSVLGKTAFEVTNAGLNRALIDAGKTVAMLAPDGQFYWLHKDHLGTVRKMTSTTGTVTYRGEFDPHGKSLLETGDTTLLNRKFTGYERDASGLEHAQARMYAGNQGRFTRPDPAGLSAANSGLPQSLNRYSYVSNDPVNFADPSGLNAASDGTSYGWEHLNPNSVIRYGQKSDQQLRDTLLMV